MKRILIVGAGFAGAVHARQLAEAGFLIHLVDQRSHIAGNAFDYVDQNGIRVHAYGPHLFHSKMRHVIDWIRQFADFVPYTHKVRARLLSGDDVPLPINLDSVNTVFGTRFETEAEVREHLKSVSIINSEPSNAAEYLYANIGKTLTELFFRPYTKKMWALDLELLSPGVVKRIPLRMDRCDTYFPDDEIQVLPRDGYTKFFEAVLRHPNITISLRTKFRRGMETDYDFCFNSMPIDEFFGFALGSLPYRSIKFHNRTEAGLPSREWSVVNFTDDGPFTRETAWHIMPNHLVRNTGRHTLTLEEPCDYVENDMERYYPVKTADGRYDKLYENYCEMAVAECRKISFIGRCGTYKYLDMDQVINQSLVNVKKWLRTSSSAKD